MPAFAEALIRFTVFFVVFALFHSITAQEWFKEKLAAVTGEFFVENFWRVFYSGGAVYFGCSCCEQNVARCFSEFNVQDHL